MTNLILNQEIILKNPSTQNLTQSLVIQTKEVLAKDLMINMNFSIFFVLLK